MHSRHQVICAVAAALLLGCSSTSSSDGGTAPPRDAGALGPNGGQCVVECISEADCCSGPQCDTGIFHFACNAGRCEQRGCIRDLDCSDLPGGKCATLGTFGLCGKGCRLPDDCCPPLPPGVTIPPGQDHLTLTLDGGTQATFYRCGVYPQKFICTGADIEPDDAGTAGICLRVCAADADCPGVPLPDADGGLLHLRVDAGYVSLGGADGGARLFQQTCALQFPGVGTCTPGCLVDADCCAIPGVCDGPGQRQVCRSGVCTRDGCRSDQDCSAGQCLP